MKSVLLTFITFFCLGSAPCLVAQIVTDLELEYLAEQLVSNLSSRDDVDKIIVEDFTDESGATTVLGAYLADEFSNILLTTPNKSFTVFDRQSIPRPALRTSSVTPALNGIVNGAAASGDIDRRTQTTLNTGLEVVNFLTANPRDKRLRGIDAIVEGVVSTSGDNFKLIINVRRRRGGELVGGARGYLTKTPELAEKYQAMVTGGGGTGGGSIIDTYRFMHITAGLKGCHVSGRYMECKLELNSESTDTELHLYANQSRIMDTQTSKEFSPVNLKLADAYGIDNVQKTLIANEPVEVTLNFDVGPTNIQTISILEVHFWSQSTGGFTADFRGIQLR